MIHADLWNKDYLEWIKFLQETDWWITTEMKEYQWESIKGMLKHAYLYSPGYHFLYEDAGVHPDDIKTWKDFERVPFITKEMIRDNLEDFSIQVDGRQYTATGGSTGIPFGFYWDPKSFSKELASKAHQYHRTGWGEGDRQMVLRGHVIDSPNHMEFVPEFNELRCSSYHLTPENMEVYRQRAIEYKPEWIRCYPSSGVIFAHWLKETGREFPQIKGILCASENLYDFQKALMEDVFGVRVFSHYGHYELTVLAGFCEYEDTYHVLPQYGYAELLNSDDELVEPGEEGEIVGTSFIMHATPFIRYRTQDRAVLKSWGCKSCRRPYQVWESINGRLHEFIVTRTGRYISMTAINFHDDIFDHIKQVQFYQDEMGVVTLRYVPKDSCTEEHVENVKKRLMVKLGNDIELIPKRVDNIPRTARGKFRYLIQKLDIDYHDY